MLNNRFPRASAWYYITPFAFGKRNLLEDSSTGKPVVFSKSCYKNSGQTLVEIILAVAVAITVIVALVTLAVSAMRYAQSSMMRSVGEKLAAGGIEAVRITRNNSVDAYENFGGGGHYKVDGGLLVTCAEPNYFCSIPYDKFTLYRKIFVSDEIAGSYRNVFVEVRWQEGAGERRVYLSSRIYKY